MKLKKLLKVIPDEYKIGITDYGEEIMFVSYGTKEEAVMGFAQKTTFTKEDIEDMEVATVSPCARVYCVDQHVFCDTMPSLNVELQLYIAVRTEGV
jgi:hypothetical protein